MNFLFRLIVPKRVRSAFRKPRWLLLGLLVCSGWLRDKLFSETAANLVHLAGKGAFNLSESLQLSRPVCQAADALTCSITVLLITLFVIFSVARIVIDFPAFTKAMFWAVTRSYEHKLSRVEALILVAIPSAMSVTVLAGGAVSLAAFLLTAIGLCFHSTSYDFSRLKRRTDDVMKMRSNMSFVIPPDINDTSKSD